MTSKSKQDIKTFASERIPLPPFDEVGTLLPLLSPNPTALNSASPPLQLLPKYRQKFGVDSKRLITSTRDHQGRTVRWVATKSIFPSAYPSTHPNSTRSKSDPKFADIPIPSSDPEIEARETKAMRAQEFKDFQQICDRNFPSEFYQQEVVSAREEAERLKSLNPPQLWSCVERIMPTDQDGNLMGSQDGEGVTLIFCHGNGLHKEIWEPTIEELLSLVSKSDSTARIDEIWCLDRSDAGESGALNREVLGDAISWYDYPRDISQLLNHFLAPKLTDDIDWTSGQLTRAQEGQSQKKRRFIGIGHSMGGTSLTILSYHQPKLFEKIILIDPITRPFTDLLDFPIPSQTPFSLRTIGRKNAFSSKKEAEKYFHSKGVFKSWDPRAIKKHLEFGLRPIGLADGDEKTPQEVESGPCALANNKFHQAFVYAYGWQGRFSYPALENGTHQGKIWIISPIQGIFSESVNKRARDLVEGGELVEGTHSIVQEKPDVLGQKIANLLPKAAERISTRPGRVQARL